MGMCVSAVCIGCNKYEGMSVKIANPIKAGSPFAIKADDFYVGPA